MLQKYLLRLFANDQQKLPQSGLKQKKSSEILSQDTHLALFRAIAMIFVVICVLNLCQLFFGEVAIWRVIQASSVNLLLGLGIYRLPASGLSIPRQDQILTVLMAVLIVQALFNPVANLANAVWAVPLIFLMVTIVFNQKKMFVFLAAVTLISGLIIVLSKPDQQVFLGSANYLARIFICVIAILLAAYINHIYIARLRENERQISFQQMISQVTSQFVSVSAGNFDDKVRYLLKTGGEIMKADRVFTGQVLPDSGELICTAQWRAEAHFPAVELNKDLRLSSFPWFTRQLFNNQLIYLKSPADLPAEAAAEKDLMTEQGITSLLLLPIQSRGNIIGFLAFDKFGQNNGLPPHDPELLRVLANILADAIVKIENEKEIHSRAYYDNLTGLPNRILFCELLEKAIVTATADALAVIFVDLDGFKEINDTMGHDWGDHLLKQIAIRLSEKLRKDDVLARFGGDEFLILASRLTDKNELTELANQVMAVFEQPVRLEEQEFYISGSGGIAVFPEDGENVSDLIKHADLAMYAAKKNGRCQVVFCSGPMKKEVQEKMRLTNSLHRALERQEFFLDYQPIFAAQRLTIVGYEALLRWQHPEFGVLAPTVFIPLAEQNGLMAEIGKWVIKSACVQNKAWQDQGFKPHSVAVNLSAEQFYRGQLVAVIRDCLAQTGLESRFLKLEITETIAMTESDELTKTLKQLKALGVGISIDNFGTEFSSLSRLKELPLEGLKIDGSFIRGIGVNKKDEAIISVMIHLAHKLGFRVVAEAVESEAQLAFLRAKGCDAVQGDYCGQPLAAADFKKILGLHRFGY